MRTSLLAIVSLAGLLNLAGAQSFMDVSPPVEPHASAVSFDPRDPGHLLVEASTLFESFDGGLSWVSLASAPGNRGAFDGNGDLVLTNSAIPMGSGLALQRRTSLGFEVIPVPDTAPGALEQFILGVTCHPTQPGSMAIATFSYDPATDEFEQRVFGSIDNGNAWTLMAQGISDGQASRGFRDVEFVPSDDGGGLLITHTYDDISTSDASVWLSTPDLQASTQEISATGADCGVAAPRALPGRRYGFVSAPPPPFQNPLAILRREPMGAFMPVGDEGFFRDVAAGKVDPDLVLRLEPTGSEITLWFSRDGGVNWTLLLDPAGSGYAISGILGLTSTDEHVLLDARETASGDRRLLRVPVETSVGDVECPGVVNSTGRAGAIVAVGLPEASANRYLLSIRDLPAGIFYLPLASRDADLVMNPGGSSGNLCLGGFVARLGGSVGASTAWGDATARIDLTQIPMPGGTVAASQGETWRFQVWFRDVTATGASNFTNSIVTTFD